MTGFLTAALGIIGGWRAAAFLAAAIGLGVTAWAQSGRIETLQAEADADAVRIATLESAATANTGTIASLRAANKTLADGRRADRQAAEQAVERLAEQTAGLADELERERARRREIYRGDEDAKSWADAAVPAAVAERLRRHTRADGPH